VQETEAAPLFGWRSAILDSELGPTARFVALVISLHMNERGGSAFPKGVTIAKESGLNERTVWRAIGDLQDQGWITVETRPGTSNLYRATIPTGTESETVGHSVIDDRAQSHTNSSDNSSVNQKLPFEDDFDIAYKTYPRQEGRKAAHRAYVAQRRKGANPDELLVACKRMAVDCRGTDTKYIKLMATFLGPDDWWKEKLGNSDTNIESPVTLCPTCFLDHHGEECPFERAAQNDSTHLEGTTLREEAGA
jgi:hypothetical protein